MNIKEVLVFGDVAVVRLTWTLIMTPPDGMMTKSVEPGMDIFKKQDDGSWKSSAIWPMSASDALSVRRS